MDHITTKRDMQANFTNRMIDHINLQEVADLGFNFWSMLSLLIFSKASGHAKAIIVTMFGWE